MDPVTAELREIALMNVVSVRKKSFSALTIEANDIQGEYVKSTVNSVTSSVDQSYAVEASRRPVVEPINCESTNENLQGADSSEDIFGDSSDEQLPSSPSPISPILSRVDAADDLSHSTWPRKHRKASVRFTEDTTMVRQRENSSHLASAASSEWGAVTDNGYVDEGETSQKTSGASIDDVLVVDDWRKENPVPVLGDDTMNWKEREDKLQNALEWLRREISEMKKQDQLLMCQFIQLRSDVHQLKCTGTNRKSRKMAESCSDLIKSPPYLNDPGTAITKFQSTMALNNKNSMNEKFGDDDDDDDDDEYDADDPERTLLEPEYFPEFRSRTMSLLPPVQKRRLQSRMRTTRNKSFSAGSAENTDRGLSDLME
ncbi:uncharacterized protein [Amphiura filiformis]|uniref:uncharacterized protein n=1 Tax=Amphiura filiformis TaxID=82378 RepID=UPI003B2160C2